MYGKLWHTLQQKSAFLSFQWTVATYNTVTWRTPSPNFMKANPCFELCCWHKEETAGLIGNRQHCWITVKPAIWIASYTSQIFNSGALSCLTDQQKILHTRLYLLCALCCKTSSCGAKKCWKIAALTKLNFGFSWAHPSADQAKFSMREKAHGVLFNAYFHLDLFTVLPWRVKNPRFDHIFMLNILSWHQLASKSQSWMRVHNYEPSAVQQYQNNF